jgi:hypothetical protein
MLRPFVQPDASSGRKNDHGSRKLSMRIGWTSTIYGIFITPYRYDAFLDVRAIAPYRKFDCRIQLVLSGRIVPRQLLLGATSAPERIKSYDHRLSDGRAVARQRAAGLPIVCSPARMFGDALDQRHRCDHDKASRRRATDQRRRVKVSSSPAEPSITAGSMSSSSRSSLQCLKTRYSY